MPCERFEMPGGGVAIVCSRGRRSRKLCSACKAAPAERQCDWPLTGAKAGKTCDVDLCPGCAARVGPDRDYCPAHARRQAQLELAALRSAGAPCDPPAVLDCQACSGRAPRCDRCLEALVAQIRGVAEVRGSTWGAKVRDQVGNAKPWPAFGADARVTELARRKVEDLAPSDPRLLELLAALCAAAAGASYATG